MKKRLFALALAGVLAAATLTGCGSLKGDETVATVDDTKIDADLANFFARYTQATYETYYSAYLGEDKWNSDASDGETYEESVKSSVLKSLEDMILLEKHMEDYDVSITDEDKAMIKETTQQFLNDNSLDDKNLVSGNEKTVNRALTLMAVQQKMRTATRPGQIQKSQMKKQHRRAWIMCSFLIRQKMIPATAKTFPMMKKRS